jgi:hypothetical protein
MDNGANDGWGVPWDGGGDKSVASICLRLDGHLETPAMAVTIRSKFGHGCDVYWKKGDFEARVVLIRVEVEEKWTQQLQDFTTLNCAFCSEQSTRHVNTL